MYHIKQFIHGLRYGHCIKDITQCNLANLYYKETLLTLLCTRQGANQVRKDGLFPARVRDFSFLNYPDHSAGHPTSYPMGSRGSLPRSKKRLGDEADY